MQTNQSNSNKINKIKKIRGNFVAAKHSNKSMRSKNFYDPSCIHANCKHLYHRNNTCPWRYTYNTSHLTGYTPRKLDTQNESILCSSEILSG